MNEWAGSAESVLAWVIRLGTAVGALGGIAYWVDRARDRPRLKAHSTVITRTEPKKIYVELENLGTEPLSIHRNGYFKCYHRFGGIARGRYSLSDQNRHLPPRTPSTISLWVGDVAGLDPDNIIVYKAVIAPTVGRRLVIRNLRWGEPAPISLPRYLWELWKMWQYQLNLHRVWKKLRDN